MSEKIHTREFCISDYNAALQLWHRVEGLEIAEGDEREDIAQFFARNPGLSRVAVDGSAIVGLALCGNDGRRGHIYHLAVDPAYQGWRTWQAFAGRMPGWPEQGWGQTCYHHGGRR